MFQFSLLYKFVKKKDDANKKKNKKFLSKLTNLHV